MSRPQLEHVSIFRIRTPLKHPYVLSFGVVRALESVIARVTSSTHEGWGESTPLPGYSCDALGDVHAFCKALSPSLVDSPIDEALHICESVDPSQRALSTPLVIALEDLSGRMGEHAKLAPLYAPGRAERVPLVGIVSTTDPGVANEQAHHQFRAGFRSIKIKIALPDVDPTRDAAVCRAVREQCGQNVALRVDANQGYSYSQALAFLSETRDLGLALLEQPFAPDAWDLQQRLHQEQAGTPLMLDESIVTAADLDTCIARRCADWVKFKLGKQGGLVRTLDLAHRAKAAGLGVVLGNGVQNDLGCLHEARLHAAVAPDTAGEQNGFLKTTTDLLQTPIRVEEGRMTCPDTLPALAHVTHLSAQTDTFGPAPMP